MRGWATRQTQRLEGSRLGTLGSMWRCDWLWAFGIDFVIIGVRLYVHLQGALGYLNRSGI